jgi:hypothetical protein
MKRAVAHTVIVVACFANLTGVSRADINSSWQSLGQTKIHKNINTVVPFRAELSLAENNQRLKAHRVNSIVVSVTVPTAELSSLRLVNHPAKWQLADQNFLGRVTAVSISGDQQFATIFAEIGDARLQQLDLRQHDLDHDGLLSIEG